MNLYRFKGYGFRGLRAVLDAQRGEKKEAKP